MTDAKAWAGRKVGTPGVFGDWEGRLAGKRVPPFCVGLRQAQPWPVAPAGFHGAARPLRLESHHPPKSSNGCAMGAAAAVAEFAREDVMPWTIEYLPERDLVLLVVTGQLLDEDGRAQVAETIRLLNEHPSAPVLVDCSDAETLATLPALYRLPDYATELGAPWNVRVAVVIPKTRFRIETFQFFALVSRNAGYEVRLFDDQASAGEWLRRSSAVRTEAHLLAPA